ncbi:putative extracellular serine carboxypeptidase [Lachnellula suecica]|uniref:Putative extracellular serine carboxypeptidase n=1 Tax=Lachnellula suecica TaxID=602035 RepID=A0A8T9CLT5_9HELO|nr:putative extracellular serine carboxypeptidase [Lachnellula suecica]
MRAINPNPTAQVIDLPLDHFNTSDIRTFKNRYWINDTHYEKGGPIFFFDGGEAGLSDGAARVLTGKNLLFAPLELARRYRGIAMMWEHRFYGESMPFAFDEKSGVAYDGYDAYKYLTNEQALQDAVYFARNFQRVGFENLGSDSTPWVWIGGSYPGMRAAMIRQRNPDVFFASWASSAPVQAQVENPVYWNTILQTMPKNCSADVHAAITYADGILIHGNEEEIALFRRAVFLANSADPKQGLHFENPESMTRWNIASILAYPFQRGMPTFQISGYNGALGDFCNEIELWNPSNFSGFTMDSPISVISNNTLDSNFTNAGVASTYGDEKAFYAYLFSLIQKSIRAAEQFPRNWRIRHDEISWAWQLCSQNAQFQVSSYPSPTNLLSRFYDITNHAKHFCHDRLPFVPEQPDVDAILRYGGWSMKPSNTMFTDGALDPWRALGVHSTADINPDAKDRHMTTEVPLCNEAPDGNAVLGAGVSW